MMCLSCHSSNQRTFPSELNIHFPGFEGLNRPTVWAFPLLLVCLDCGFTQFSLSGDQVEQLSESDSPHSGSEAA